jgi:hypothetical protein
MPNFRFSLLALFFFACTLPALAQELNCTVTINSQQVMGTDRRIFETLKNALTEFMNNTRWTNDNFRPEERIECSITLTLTGRPSVDEFQSGLVIQARRPTYKTNYNSLIVNLNDPDVNFKYVEFQPLEFNENTFANNLTAVMGFYAFVILGVDYDSFSLEGGTPFFQKAQNIVNNAQGAADKGWKAFESNKNRYWIAEGFTNGNYKALRKTMYNYHRKGLDVMATDVEGGRQAIFDALDGLKAVHNLVPGSFMMQQFFWAKADEVVNLFTPSPSEQKNKIIALVNLLDPGNAVKYQRLQ